MFCVCYIRLQKKPLLTQKIYIQCRNELYKRNSEILNFLKRKFVSAYVYLGNYILVNPEVPIKSIFLLVAEMSGGTACKWLYICVSQAILCVRNVDVDHINVKFIKALAESCIIHYQFSGGAYCRLH